MLTERRRQVPQAEIAEVRDPRPVLRRRSFPATAGNCRVAEIAEAVGVHRTTVYHVYDYLKKER